MKKFVNPLLLLFTLLAMLAVAGCGGQENNATEPATEQTGKEAGTGEKQEQSVQIEIIKDEEIIVKKNIKISKDDILLDVLKDNFSIEEDKGFITGIEGVRPEGEEKNKYGWLYYVNGDMAKVGAADYKLQPGDQVKFEYTEYK